MKECTDCSGTGTRMFRGDHADCETCDGSGRDIAVRPDIVYPVGTGSRWSGRELIYSLRSVERCLKGHGRVVIAGKLPDTIAPSRVLHLPLTDDARGQGAKITNTSRKLLAVCEDDRITEDFILLHDDFFFFAPVRDIPYYHSGTLAELEQRLRKFGNYYHRAASNTLDYLRAEGIPEPLNFEMHYPMVRNRLWWQELIGPLVRSDTQIMARSVYCNLLGVPSAPAKDWKATTPSQWHQCVLRGFVSPDDHLVLRQSIRNSLMGAYPSPSQYERRPTPTEDVDIRRRRRAVTA